MLLTEWKKWTFYLRYHLIIQTTVVINLVSWIILLIPFGKSIFRQLKTSIILCFYMGSAWSSAQPAFCHSELTQMAYWLSWFRWLIIGKNFFLEGNETLFFSIGLKMGLHLKSIQYTSLVYLKNSKNPPIEFAGSKNFMIFESGKQVYNKKWWNK